MGSEMCRFVVSLIMVAFTLYYEPFHGRRLIATGLFAAPTLAAFFTPLFQG